MQKTVTKKETPKPRRAVKRSNPAVTPELSAKRRAASLSQWEGKERVPYKTIRLSARAVEMIRSAAKNHDRVCVITNPVDFDLVIDEIQATNDTTLATRRRLAAKAFSLTAEYDAMISRYFQKEEYPEKISLPYTLNAILRYGENPHQSAALYETKAKVPFSVVTAQQLHGKQLSYNNI